MLYFPYICQVEGVLLRPVMYSFEVKVINSSCDLVLDIIGFIVIIQDYRDSFTKLLSKVLFFEVEQSCKKQFTDILCIPFFLQFKSLRPDLTIPSPLKMPIITGTAALGKIS